MAKLNPMEEQEVRELLRHAELRKRKGMSLDQALNKIYNNDNNLCYRLILIAF